jgi:CHAD domain-containing protein
MPRSETRTKKKRHGRRDAEAADPAPEVRRAEAVAALVGGELKRQASALSLPGGGGEGTLSVPRTHAMRIATRRARSALRTFRDALPAGLARLEPDLKWLADVLGSVRDLDVYQERYRQRRAELPEEDAAALQRYETHLDREHADVCEALTAALASDRCTTLIDAFAVLRDTAADDAFDVPDAIELGEVAKRYVGVVVKRVLKRGRGIDEGSPAERLHDLRKEIKRLRYLLELLEPYLEDGARRLRRAVVRLQDVLGEHQDACAAEVRVCAYLDAAADEPSCRRESFALGRLAEAERLAARKARKRFARTWRRFDETASSV